MHIDYILYYIYLFLVFLGFAVSIINRKHLGNYGPYLSIMLGTVLFFESFDYMIDEHTGNILDHFYQPLEFTIMVLIYSRVINYAWFKRLELPLILSFWVLSLWLSVGVEGLENPNTLSYVIGGFLTIVLAIIFHFQLLTKPLKDRSLFSLPFFWINTAHLFFFVGTFFQMGFNAYLHQRAPEIAHDLFLINYALNFSLYALYLIGLTCRQIFK